MSEGSREVILRARVQGRVAADEGREGRRTKDAKDEGRRTRRTKDAADEGRGDRASRAYRLVYDPVVRKGFP